MRAIARHVTPVVDGAGRAGRNAGVAVVADRGIDDVVARVVRDRVDRAGLFARVAADADLRIDQVLADDLDGCRLPHACAPEMLAASAEAHVLEIDRQVVDAA